MNIHEYTRIVHKYFVLLNSYWLEPETVRNGVEQWNDLIGCDILIGVPENYIHFELSLKIVELMLVNRGLTVAKVHHSPSDFKQMENCPGFGKFWEIKKSLSNAH